MRSRTSARISSTCTPVRSFTVPTPPGPAILTFRPLSAPLARHNSACSAAFSAQGGLYVLEKVLELFVSAKVGAVSGAIILAGGAIVSASTSAGVATVAMQDPTPTPIVQPLEGSEPFEFEVTLDEPADGAEENEPPADPGGADDG